VLAVSLQLINGFSGQFSLGHAGFMMVGAYLAAYPAMTHSNGLANPAGTVWFYLSLAVVTVAAALLVLCLFLLVRTSRKLHRLLPTLLLIAMALWVVVDTVWYLLIVVLLSKLLYWLKRAEIRHRLERVSGAVLIALGIRLALEST
jgi:ABC-type branched-subunit amino acid transport system permease subunit